MYVKIAKVEGIVIRTTDYGETNKIVTIYTREAGKIAVMANGAKKPKSKFTGITQLFTYGHFLVTQSNGMGRLQQGGEIIHFFRGIREDIFKTAYASYLAELIDRVTEDKQPNPFMFELLYQSLQKIEDDFDPEIIMNIFEMKMLNPAGVYPYLDGCVLCGCKEGNFGYSIREGGFICGDCAEKDPYHYRLSAASVRLLRLFYYFDLTRLGSIQVKEETKRELNQVISAIYEDQTGYVFKTKKFINQIDSIKCI